MLNALQVLMSSVTLLKRVKYYVDSIIRDQVVPVPGSVLYCDLWNYMEHSGIYVGDGAISNIVVDGLGTSKVMLDSASSFTSKSSMGKKIYVSSNKHGVVGNNVVAEGAYEHVGDKDIYLLIYKNCHQFSEKCVNYADGADLELSLLDRMGGFLSLESWEPTLRDLKATARKKLGATKWRLWDWDNDIRDNPPAEPDWQAVAEAFRNVPLNPETIKSIQHELIELRDYEQEIADEQIPDEIRKHLAGVRQALASITTKYEEVKEFLQGCPDSEFSYADLKLLKDDFQALSKEMASNTAIKDLAHKMGRAYISEEKKRQTRLPEASKSEVYGTHRSDDLQRLLPSELLNLKDEDEDEDKDDELEMLFYAKLLEKNLQCYELSGVTFKNGEELEATKKRTGPVVACLDTSGSMSGSPILKAKALLLAIANILQKEDRSLYVLLFGDTGQISEFEMTSATLIKDLLLFLQSGFNGGTDFEPPLRRAMEIIEGYEDFLKADVLMISDGDCNLNTEFCAYLKRKKHLLDCSIYSVLCAGHRAEDGFSDEVIVL